MNYLKYIVFLLFFLSTLSAFAQSKIKTLLDAKNYEGLNVYQNDEEWKKLNFTNINDLIVAMVDADMPTFKQIIQAIGRTHTLQTTSLSYLKSINFPYSYSPIFIILDKHRKIALENNDWQEWPSITITLARSCYYIHEKGSLQKAGIYYDELMKEWDKYNITTQMNASLLAGNHFMGVEQDYEKAANYYEKAANSKNIALEDKIPIYAYLSELYLRKKDLEKALEYSNEVLAFAQTPLRIKLQQLTRVGTIYKEQELLVEAEKKLLQAEQLLIESGQTKNIDAFAAANFAYVYTGLLDIQLKRKNYTNAQKYVAILEKERFNIGFQGQVSDLIFYHRLKYYLAVNDVKSFGELEKILYLTNADEYSVMAKSYTLVGEFWTTQHDLPKALEFYNKGLELLKGNSNTDFGYLYNKDEPQALELLSKKMELLYLQKKATPNHQQLNKELYETAQQAVLLLDQIRQGLSTKEAKLQILNAAPLIYEHAIEVTWSLYQELKDKKFLKEIYVLMEKSKAMLLLEAMNESSAKNFGGVPDALRKQEKTLASELKFYKSKLDRAQSMKDSLQEVSIQRIMFDKRKQLEQLKANLEKQYPKYYELKFKTEIAALETLQKELQVKNALFVSYFVGKLNLYVLSINSGSINVRVESMTSSVLANYPKDLLDFRTKLSTISDFKNWDKVYFKKMAILSYAFYKILLEPELKKCTTSRLILSLDDLLHYIPFEALFTSDVTNSGEGTFKNAPYLLHQQIVSYNYTATLWLKSLELKQQLKPTTQGILAMAATYNTPLDLMHKDWRETRKNLIELEGAQQEVKLLENSYRGSFLIGADATESTFKQQAASYNIIHLAMHGLLDNKNPMHSGLVFTEDGDSTTDNILLAYELSDLELNTDLLILSACSTGDGEYKKGEGVMSLGRGFMYAGTASIMTTLWQINDQSTNQLMKFFYENINAGIEKDKALQQAKIKFIELVDGNIAHPVFWSAHVFMGDTGTVNLYQKSAWWYWALGVIALVAVGLVARKFVKK